MKKIERFDITLNCFDNKKVAVNKSDLDELEQQRDEAVEALQDICKMGDEKIACYGTMGILIDAVNIAQKALK